MNNSVFVFGSNLSGIHGAGAALRAYKHHGATWGQGEGHMGQSYGIPTKGYFNEMTGRFAILKLWEINAHVGVFKMFAHSRPDLTFNLTPIGCGHAGYHPSYIAPMFRGCPQNVKLPRDFQDI